MSAGYVIGTSQTPSAGGALLTTFTKLLTLPAVPFLSLPTPGAGTGYPIAIVSDSSATSGTVSVGGSTHVNVVIWTGAVWTVLKNVT